LGKIALVSLSIVLLQLKYLARREVHHRADGNDARKKMMLTKKQEESHVGR
jgi:hypothetical protein